MTKLFCSLSRNQPTGLCFHPFATPRIVSAIQTEMMPINVKPYYRYMSPEIAGLEILTAHNSFKRPAH